MTRKLNFKHQVPTLSCNIVRVLEAVVCNSVAHIIAMIVAYLLVHLLDNFHFCVSERLEIYNLYYFACLWIDTHHSICVEYVGPDVAIYELELIYAGLRLTRPLLHGELAEFLEACRINNGYLVAAVRDVEHLLFGVKSDAPALFDVGPHFEPCLLL